MADDCQAVVGFAYLPLFTVDWVPTMLSRSFIVPNSPAHHVQVVVSYFSLPAATALNSPVALRLSLSGF